MKTARVFLLVISQIFILICMVNAQTSFNVSNKTTGDTLLTIDNTGNVGIGTTTPTEMLEVNGSVYSTTGGFMFPDGSVQNSAASLGTFGINDLTDGKTGTYSLFLGTGAGQLDIGNAYNTGVGINVLSGSYVGDYNSAFGYWSLRDNRGNLNTAIGYYTLRWNINGNYNTACGSYAGFSNIDGNENTAIGAYALTANLAGRNTAVGYSALRWNNTGEDNVAIGDSAYFSNQSGSENTIIGTLAGQASYGSGNVFLGYRAGYNETGSNKLYIENTSSSSPLIGGDFAADEIYLNGSVGISGPVSIYDSAGIEGNVRINGSVGIGTSTPTEMLQVADTIYSSVGGFKFPDGTILESANNAPGDNTLDRAYDQGGAGAGRTITADAGAVNIAGSAGLTVNGNVGIGTTNPLSALSVGGDGNADYAIYAEAAGSNGIGVYGTGDDIGVRGYSAAAGGMGVYGLSSSTSATASYAGYFSAAGSSSYGVYATAPISTWAGWFEGNVAVTGNLFKGGGSFKIDHPLDPENKYLLHSFVESPDMMNIYNGNVLTDADGNATVELPEWFESLNLDFRYQLTVIGEFAQAIISSEVSENQFSIKTDKAGVKVSWQVTGIRHDKFANANRIPVEEDKENKERGKYLHPRVFGLDKTQGIGYK